MKKFTLMMMAVCLMLTIAGCSGGSGDLKGFLADAEGDWYNRGDSSSNMLRIEADGAWEFYEIPESGSERSLSDSGGADSVSYDDEYKHWVFDGASRLYPCETSSDGLLTFMGATYVPAEQSRDLGETFNGEWYLDGDRNQDYYIFADGVWDYWVALGIGHSSTDSGYLTYRGGDTRTLTAIDMNEDDPFAVLTVVGDDEIKSADGKSYLRLEATASNDNDEEYGLDEDEDDYDSDASAEISGADIVVDSFYYWNGDSEEDSLYFWDDNTVDYDEPGEETVYGTYSIDGDTLTIIWDSGAETILSIEDDGTTVIDEQGECFYLAE